jgi:hypothetical protein
MIVAIYNGGWCAYMQQGDEPYTDEEIEDALYFKIFSDKLGAVGYAQKICKKEIVEHGIRIDD